MSRNEPLAAVYTTDAGGGGAFGVTCTGVLVRVRTGGAFGVVVAGTLDPTSRSAAPDSGCAIVRLRAVLSAPGLFAWSPLAQASSPTVASAAARVFMGPPGLSFPEQQNLCKLAAARSSQATAGSGGSAASGPAASWRAA